MAQPIDPDIRSSDRSESPAGTVFRRLFAFWRRDEDLAPEVSPTMPQRSESKGIKPRSRAFTIWTSATNRRSGTRELSPAGRYIVDEFNGFTLWSTPEAVAGSVAAARVANQEAIASPPSRAFSTWTTPAALASQAERWKPALIKLPPSEAFTLWSQPAIREMIAPHGENPAAISLPPSQAFSTWTTPAALASQAERWKPAPIKLPPSKAFTLWSQPAIREMIAPRGENPAVISLPPSQAFSAWTTAAALASQADRWTPPLIKLPPSEAFTLWSHQSILPLLADQWEESASAGCISLTEPKPFTAWTTPEALGEMAERWSTEPMIKLKDPHPFSIWTLSSSAGKSNPANPADAAPSLPAAIRIEEPNAHSIWTTVEGLAAASARWIPSNATAKVEAIPIAFSSSTESSEDGQTERSNITPFPTGDSDSDAEAQQEPETISNFANQNNMEDHTTNPIKLANSNAFTLWSTPDKWTPNLVSASAGTPVNPAGEVESSAPAAALADTPEPKTKSPTAEQPAVSGDSDGVGFWKWAFILASVLGVGIIASQAIALGEAKENNKIEIASRLKVAGDLEMQKAANLDLTDQLVASEAKIQAVSNQKADIEVEMGRTEAAMTEQITKLDGTVAVQKKELAAKASTVGGMETALGTMKSENEAAAKKIAGLAEEIEAKAKALKESGTALDAAKAQASKLETASKELDAKLNMSGNDQDALTKELQASSDALSAAKQASAELEKQVAEMKAKIEALQKPVPAE